MVKVSLKSSVEELSKVREFTSVCAPGARLDCSGLWSLVGKAQGKLNLGNFPKPCEDVRSLF